MERYAGWTTATVNTLRWYSFLQKLKMCSDYDYLGFCTVKEVNAQLKILTDLQVVLTASVQFSSVQLLTQSCLTLCDPMNCSTPGPPVHHQLREFTLTHVHWVGEAVQPSHPLSSLSPPVPNHSQHLSFPMSQLLAWGGQSIGVSALASGLPMNIQDFRMIL